MDFHKILIGFDCISFGNPMDFHKILTGFDCISLGSRKARVESHVKTFDDVFVTVLGFRIMVLCNFSAVLQRLGRAIFATLPCQAPGLLVLCRPVFLIRVVRFLCPSLSFHSSLFCAPHAVH